MGGRILLALTLPLELIALVVGIVRLVTASALDREAARVRLRATLVTAACFVVVLAAVYFSPVPAEEDVRLATLPAVAGLVGVVVAGLSEGLWRARRGPAREASLRIRHDPGAESDRGLWRRYLLGLGVSAGMVVVGGATAAADGRSVARAWATGAASTGPYPGWTYGVPIAVALTLLAAATWWALRQVDARPVLDVERPALDRALRTGSRVRVLRFAAGGTVLTAAGLALSAGNSLAQLAQNLRMPGAPGGRAPWDWTQNAGFGLIGVAIALILVAIQVLLWDAPAIPRAEAAADASREVSV